MVSPHPDEMEAQALAAWQPDDPDTPDYYDEELRRAHEWPHVAKEMAHTIDPTAEVGCWYGDADYPYDWVLEQYYGGEVPPRPLDPVCMYYARAPLPEPLSR